jgi:16S rRNA processing protein RimM
MLPIAVVIKPHGLRGVCKILPHFSLTELLEHFSEVWLTRDKQVRRFIKEWYRQTGRFGHLKLEGFESAEDVEIYRGWLICVPREGLPVLSKGRYYTFQIIGLKAVTEDGRVIGTVTDVLAMPAHDLYAVETEMGEILIPAVKAHVSEIDLASGRIIVRAVSGLLD